MDALVLVDIQNDFLPGGALAVPEGDLILPCVNQLVTLPIDHLIATKDYHPKGHVSFAKTHNKAVYDVVLANGVEQILWPEHCVQGSLGAEFSAGWNSHVVSHVFYKGVDAAIDSYSAFFDNKHLKATGLEAFLKGKGVQDVYFAGLATDYCVKYSVHDALMLGFKAFVIVDACRGVNINPNDSALSLCEMEKRGAKLVTYKEVAHMMQSKRDSSFGPHIWKS